ncbi:MAG: ProQ/FINO family protein [Halomonas sp.]|uniref:ProQ/FINO family protein n=1 Tax=Halomonas sp. TaxID=1486246 RepID=UPI00397096F1
MTEERSIRLLDALEGRTDILLGRLRQERESCLALQRRLAELEAARLALAEKSRELMEERRELVEENRELDEQNRELEEHNRHLHERLAKGPGDATFPRPARRSQGLSALMGRRAAPTSDAMRNTLEANRTRLSAPEPARDVDAPAEPATAASPAGVTASPRIAEDTSPSEASIAAGQTDDSNAQAAGSQDALAVGEAPSPQALLGEWYRRYGAAFFKGHTRPLKVGIHEELAALEPWPEKLVRRALACYVNLPRYLKAVREGAERIDLDGKPAGAVDAKAAEHARKKLDRLQAERRGKPQSGTPPREGREKRGAKPAQPDTSSGGKPAVKAALGPSDVAPAAKREASESAPSHPAQNTPSPSQPRPAAEKRFVTMEEKLAALVAKHRQP